MSREPTVQPGAQALWLAPRKAWDRKRSGLHRERRGGASVLACSQAAEREPLRIARICRLGFEL